MLSQDIARYVQLRRSVGYKFRSQALLLRSFAAFAAQHKDRWIRSARVLDWAAQAPSRAQRHNRLVTLRRFALAVHAEDARHQIPPDDAFGRARFARRAPHIYEPGEIAALVNAAELLQPSGSIRPATYATLISLMAATGLRVSEVLNLEIDDMSEDGLLIRQTKFSKSRIVPLHWTTRNALEDYRRLRARVHSRSRSLLIAPSGSGPKYPTVIRVFLGLARATGLRGAPGEKGPRLHDLRHTFAVRSLEACQGDADAIARHTLALSTYLGHAHVSDTYWYLQATPLLMGRIARAGEALYRGVQP